MKEEIMAEVVAEQTASVVPKRKVNRYSDFEKRKFLFVYLLIAFPVIQFLIFWFYVNVSSIGNAFTNAKGEFTFGNFKEVSEAFFQKDMWGYSLMDSLGNSLKVWCLSNLVLFPWGLVSVYVLCCNIRGHYFFRLCEILPSLIGSVIWATIVRAAIQVNGPVITLMQSMGINLPDVALHNGLLGAEETAFPTLMAIMVVGGLVSNSPVLSGAYARISNELFESAELDGAGFFRKFWSIGLPGIWPTVTTLMIFNLTSVFTADCGVFLYTNGTGEPGCSTVGFQLYILTLRLAEGGSSNYGYPAALGFVLTLMTLPICLIGRRLLEKLCDTVEN
jgi:ABC-type sugar transport system permease subunit